METQATNYKVLHQVNSPADLKKLSIHDLKIYCDELRRYIIETVNKTGGHLAPSLGTIELTVALHYVYDTPKDKLVWDVGHQAYGHKVITGRRDRLNTIRQYGGISGFCKRKESEYDAYGAGHASTSISAAAGFAAVRNLEKSNNKIVAIIGDGSFTGGLAYEGLNNITEIGGQFLMIINDNEMSISPNVGAMSNYFTKIVRNPQYLYYKNRIWNTLEKLPKGGNFFRRMGQYILRPIKKLLAPSVLFEEFGFRYYGPVNGHNLRKLISVFKDLKELNYPVLLHVQTIKGKGLKIAEEDPTKYHGISPKKKQLDTLGKKIPDQAFLHAFGKIAIEIADKYPKANFITAAMQTGTGLTEYARKYPDRYFDVGIAEGHAVTFAAGMAAEGYRPVVAIYSTFLQRAYDHVIHDVALQNLPVIFALDRAGVVGPDGPTHHGVYDLSYLNTVPNLIVAAPRDGNELRNLLFTAMDQDKQPFAVRYPKEKCHEFQESKQPELLKIGKWERIQEGKKVAVISTGTMTNTLINILPTLAEEKITPSLYHAVFVKPMDTELLLKIGKKYKKIITVEENTIVGGLGSKISQFIDDHDFKARVYNFAIPDEFVTQGTRGQLLNEVGLSEEKLIDRIREIW